MWKRISLILISLIVIVFLAKTLYGIATAPPLGAHFPQQIKPASAYPDVLIKGELVLENGCLRVSGVINAFSGYSFLLIWDPRFSTQTEQGIVQVIDSNTGKVLASVGDFVAIGGDTPSTNLIGMWLKQPIPDKCPGPYWLVGDPLKKIDKP